MRMPQISVENSSDVIVFILAHASDEQELVFSRLELQAAMYHLKQQLPEAARERDFLGRLLFDTNGNVPFSEQLENFVDFWVYCGHLATKSATDTRYHLDSDWARRRHDTRQFSSEDRAILEPLVPIFIECLNAAIVQYGGDNKEPSHD
jgi:hypothetical protein